MARNKFDVDEELENSFNFKHFLRLLKYVKPYLFKMIITIIVLLIASMASLLTPYLVKIAIDTEIPNKNIAGLFISGCHFCLITYYQWC